MDGFSIALYVFRSIASQRMEYNVWFHTSLLQS